MEKRKRNVELSGVKPSRIVAICGNTHYIWERGQEAMDHLDKMRADHAYEALHGDKVKTSRVSDVFADYDTDRAFVFYVADCFSPPMFLVWGKSESDAYESFINEFENLIKIDEEALKDYDEERLTYNDNGTPVDCESVQWISVDRLILTV